MPWKLGSHKSCPPSKPVAVLKKDGGGLVACHTNRFMAVKQIRALYANEGLVYLDEIDQAVEVMIDRRRAQSDVTGTAVEALWTNTEQGTPQAEIVIVRPGMSKNGRFYTQEAIRKAVDSGFWNNSKMFLDHGDPRMPMMRSVRDLMSGVTETWLGTEGEARGRVSFFDPAFAKFAQEAQKHIGVSISHEFSGRRFRDPATHQIREQVDEFKRNHSVDWVAFPAAGGEITKFFHATESEDDVANVDWSALDTEMLREHRPDLIAEIASASAAESDTGDGTGNPVPAPFPDPVPDPTPDPAPEPVPAAAGVPIVGMSQEQIAALVDERVNTAQATFLKRRDDEAAVRRQVAEQLAKSGLPGKTQTRLAATFDGQTEFIEASVTEAIDEAKAELAEARGARPRVTDAGPSGTGVPIQGAALESRYPAMAALNKAMGFKPDADSTGREN